MISPVCIDAFNPVTRIKTLLLNNKHENTLLIFYFFLS